MRSWHISPDDLLRPLCAICRLFVALVASHLALTGPNGRAWVSVVNGCCVLSLSRKHWNLVFAVHLLMGFGTSAISWARFSWFSSPLLFGYYYFICVCDISWSKCFPSQ